MQELRAFAGEFTRGHIWQKDPFELAMPAQASGAPPHLEGSTVFGDNMEDEWLVVFLLFQLTVRFPDLVVQ